MLVTFFYFFRFQLPYFRAAEALDVGTCFRVIVPGPGCRWYWALSAWVYSSAAGDGVNFVDAVHFSGGGKLVVRGDGGGTILIFR